MSLFLHFLQRVFEDKTKTCQGETKELPKQSKAFPKIFKVHWRKNNMQNVSYEEKTSMSLAH